MILGYKCLYEQEPLSMWDMLDLFDDNYRYSYLSDEEMFRYITKVPRRSK